MKSYRLTSLTRISLLLAALFFVVLELSAQSGSLYGASVSESAVKVRLVNTGAQGPVSLYVGAYKLAAQTAGEATPYLPVASDIYMFLYAGESYEFLPEVGTWYTIAALADKLVFLADPAHKDPARAQLFLYNLGGSGSAELRTADGSLTVVPAVAAAGNAQVAVNPVSVSLAVFRNGQKAGSDHALHLQRGASYGIFIYDSAAGPRSFLVEAVVGND